MSRAPRAAVESGGEPSPAGLGPRALNVWRGLALTTVLGCVATVGIAASGSESDGVAAAMLASVPIGSLLGAWGALGWARRNRRSHLWLVAGIVLGGVIGFGAALFFFEGIFPAL